MSSMCARNSRREHTSHCVRVCVCVCVHAHEHLCIRIFIHVCSHVCICLSVFVTFVNNIFRSSDLSVILVVEIVCFTSTSECIKPSKRLSRSIAAVK